MRIVLTLAASVTVLFLKDFTVAGEVQGGNEQAVERTFLKKDGRQWRRIVRRGHTIVSREAADAPRDRVPTAIGSAEEPRYLRPYVTYPLGSWPEAVAIGDLNHDGLNDVALVTSFYFDPVNDYSLFVFLQSGSGSLLAPVRYPVGGDPSSVDIGDVNGDGRDDVVVGRGDGIFVLLQNANGTLNPGLNYATSFSEKIQIGDFDSDGRMDIAGIDWGSQHQVVVFTQQPNGTLALAAMYNGSHDGYNDLEVGDLNADGRDDLIVMSGQGFAPNVSVFLQQPGGLFDTATVYDLGGNELTQSVGVGDLDGDGRNDLAVSFGIGLDVSPTVAIWFQNILGALDQPAARFPSSGIPTALEVADINSDGRRDAIVTHGLSLGVYRQESDGSLVSEELFPIPYGSGFNPHGLAVGDINGDGAADVVIADYNNGLVVLRQNIAGLNATSVSSNAISVTWNSFPGATAYEVYRRGAGGSFTIIGNSSGNSFLDSSVAAGVSYLYRIRALYPNGRSTWSAFDLATTVPFTDDPLVPQETIIKAVHLTELRTGVNAVRALAGLPPFTFTDSDVTGALVRTTHIKELRLAIDPALAALGIEAGQYGEAIIVRGIIMASHFEEIRARVR
jgi:VCBS repeat protein